MATDATQTTAAAEPHSLLEPHQIILRPLVTEKGMHRSTRNNAYAFEVNTLATKDDVRRAVEELFNVKVREGPHAEPQGQAAPHAVSQPGTPKTGRRPS